MLGIVFALVIAALLVNALVKDRRAYQRFARLNSSARRRATMRKWVLQSLARFGGLSIITLVLDWQYTPLVLADINGWGWIADARATYAAHEGVGRGILIGVVVAIVGGTVLAIVAARKETELVTVGDVRALLPRNRAELPWGAALSINAGIVEELLFRLSMPALIFAFTGSSVAAVVVSLIVFGALHAYQGIAGVIGATVVGALLMAGFITSQSIVVAIVVHALFDLRSLVLIPVIITGAHRIRD